VKSFRTRILPNRNETGMTLIELVVAMMVFALISVALAYSMLAALRATGNSRGRVVAANLAAQEIDLVRSVDNVFNLLDDSRQQTIDGITYTVSRDTGWVNSSGGDDSCGAGSGSLQYKRVNVTVSWAGTRGGSVRADTVVAPSSKINDPAFGAIVVKVTNNSGTGVAGVAVSLSVASPADGAVKPVDSVPETDSEGCAYALKVTPGNYFVSIEKLDYVDVTQAAKPKTTTPIRVTQAAATAVPFTYDKAATVAISYAPNYAGPVSFPSNLVLSVQSTFGVALAPRAASLKLFPFGSGYSIYSGAITNLPGGAPACDSLDPARWPDGVRDSQPISSGPAPSFETHPGESSSVALEMGVLRVSNSSNSNWTDVSAVQVTETDAAGDPGCSLAPVTLALGSVKANSSSSIALPYGTWRIVLGTTSSGSSITSVLNLTPGQTSGAQVTLDPRIP
jgi:prepilin-type N-terminal cleavage/methylation domain-containing protein